jgi:hypothetical protein
LHALQRWLPRLISSCFGTEPTEIAASYPDLNIELDKKVSDIIQAEKASTPTKWSCLAGLSRSYPSFKADD